MKESLFMDFLKYQKLHKDIAKVEKRLTKPKTKAPTKTKF